MARTVKLGVGEAERWIFVPEMPTPNGRLHLGHMSGPYLKADVLARYLRQRGAEAYLVSGSDSFESHVELAAVQRERTHAEIANDFHKKIVEEYDALGIRMELYLNPLDPEVNEEYIATNRRLFDHLRETATTATLAEKIFYSAKADRHLAGCWLSGKCPTCGTKSGSYLCEACGTEYSPQDVLDVRRDPDLEPYELRNVPSRFMRLTKVEELWRHLALSGTSADFTRIVAQYLRDRGDKVRLTNPSNWGIPTGAPGQVLFTYTALYFFSVFCSEVLARRKGWDTAPFHAESTALTIGSFGIDNAVPYLLSGVAVALESGNYKPFDFFLTNHFYQLEGKKFSTSRRHLVCAAELCRAGVHSDLLRYYLSKVTPEKGPRSFVVADFLGVYRGLEQTLGAGIAQALTVASAAKGAPSEHWLEAFDRAAQHQEQALAFPNPSSEAYVRVVDEWIARGAVLGSADSNTQANSTYWWLAGLCVLANALMPRLTQQLWSYLGRSGEPLPLNAGSTPAMVSSSAWEPFVELSTSKVEQAISREQEQPR